MSHISDQHGGKEHRGHETSDADVKMVLKFLVGLGVLMAFVIALMSGMYQFLDSYFGRSEAQISNLIDTRQIPPGPKLQADPAVELVETRDREERLLNTYEWIDEDTGVFRIPIERAMDLVAESGLPARGD